jgi:peptide deformylase
LDGEPPENSSDSARQFPQHQFFQERFHGPIAHFAIPRSPAAQEGGPVAQVDARIRQLAADMAETMYAAPGIGLAASQVDQHVRLIVIDISEDKSQLQTFINPELLEKSGECEGEEGCLSVPGIYETVRRASHVRVRALGLDGKPFELEADDLLAVCIQHEMDHLEGKVFVEYLSRLKQTRIKSKLVKQARETF